MIKSEGVIFNASASLKSVVKLGCLSPLSSKEIKVRSNSHSKASDSCDNPAPFRKSLKICPKILLMSIAMPFKLKDIFGWM